MLKDDWEEKEKKEPSQGKEGGTKGEEESVDAGERSYRVSTNDCPRGVAVHI